MTSKMEPQDPVVAQFTAEDDSLAVKPVDSKSIVPVDGPVPKAMDSSTIAAVKPASDPDISSDSDQPALDSPFRSPKSGPVDGMSVTTLEDDEIAEELLEGGRAAAIGDAERKEGGAEVADVEVGVKETGEENEEEGRGVDAATITPVDAAEEPKEDHVKPEVSENALTDAHTSAKTEVATEGHASGNAPRDTQEVSGPSSRTPNVDKDIAVTDGEESDARTTTQSQPARNVPPHLRADFQSPAIQQASAKYSTSAREVPRYVDIPRAPRAQYPTNAYQTYRSDGGREELARKHADLMKMRNELEAERKKLAGMRKLIEEETRMGMDATLGSLTANLFNEQYKTLAHQQKVDAKERELRFREDRIEQLEIFLSEGQKYAYRQENEEEGGLSMAEVRSEHERRQAELAVRKDFADREHKLAVHKQALQLREAGLQMREQQYKALVRGKLEAEMRDKTLPDMEAKLEAVANVEYNRGFGAGKVAGRGEVEEETRQQGFLEGYQACHRAQVVLSNLRHGRIARDSPELDFIYDPAHSHSLFAMGARVGGLLSAEKGKKPMATIAVHQQTHSQGQMEKPVQGQKKAEEPVLKLPAPRPTFASELRGAQTMHNGHVVLANGSGSSSPMPAPITTGNNVASRVGEGVYEGSRVGEGVYEGRRIVQYEELEHNLIDLM